MTSLEDIGYSKAKEYVETIKQIVGLKKDMVQAILNRNVIDKLETVFERVPQCAVILGFVFAIRDFPKIGYAIRNSFGEIQVDAAYQIWYHSTSKSWKNTAWVDDDDENAGSGETVWMVFFVAIALWGILRSFITERYLCIDIFYT